MGVTSIEWTAYALQRQGELAPCLSAPQSSYWGCMLFVVAIPAKSNSVAHREAQFWVCRKGLDMVGLQVPPSGVPTFLAGEVVATVHIKSPPLQFSSVTKTAALRAFAVNIRVACIPTWRALSRDATNLYSRINRMLFSETIARPLLRCRAHFGTAFSGHFRSFAHEAF